MFPFSPKLLNGSSILVTGGTGSFGRKFVRMTLKKFSPKKIVIFSRDEMKQWEMAQEFNNDPRLRFFVGDVRDKDRLHRACQGIDHIVHAAAIKIVPSAEYNPFECIKTNVIGAMNVIDCAIDARIQRVIALSTDKACSPINLYGASKLCSDKLFIAGNSYAGNSPTRFAVVRYGNVMGSRGSIIPLFMKQAKTGELLVTDERMTRFMITLEQGVELVWFALHDCSGGEIYVKKIPSMRVVDIAKAIAPEARITFTGIRPGEKLHEQMISVEDSRTTREFDSHYIILPQIILHENGFSRSAHGAACPAEFCYSSETNSQWLTCDALQQWIANEYNPQSEPALMASKGNEGAFTISDTILQEIDVLLPPLAAVRESFSQVRICVTCARPDLALEQTEKLAGLAEAPPEMLLLKAQLQTALQRPYEAMQSLLHFLRMRPDDDRATALMKQLGGIVHMESILDLT